MAVLTPILLLDDIEAGDSRLLETLARVFQRGGFKSLDLIRLHTHINNDG
jgi:hypothetical protein